MDNQNLVHELHHSKNDLSGLQVLGVREDVAGEISASSAVFLSLFRDYLPIQKYQEYWVDFQYITLPRVIKYILRSPSGAKLISGRFRVLPGRELNALADAAISIGIDDWDNDNGLHDNQIFINKQLEVDGEINRPENYNEQENIEEMFTYKINGRKTNLLRLASADVRNRLDSIINATEHRADSLLVARRNGKE